MEGQEQLQPMQNLIRNNKRFHKQQVIEDSQCEELPDKEAVEAASQLASARTSGGQAKKQRNKGSLVFVMAEKRPLDSNKYSKARANLALIRESKSRFIYPEIADVQLPTRSRYRSDRRMISTQRFRRSSQSKSTADFLEGVDVQAPIALRGQFGSDPRAIAPHHHSWSTHSKSRLITPMLAATQSSSNVKRDLQSGTFHPQVAATDKNNYGRPPNTNDFRYQSMERSGRINEDCEYKQTISGASPSRRTSKIPSWPQPQTSTPDDAHDNGGKKNKIKGTSGSSSAQWKTAHRTAQLLANQYPSVVSSQLNQQSVMRSRRLGRQENCQEVAATDCSFVVQRDTRHRREMMSTSNMVYDQLPPIQKSSVTSSHLDQHSAIRSYRSSRKYIFQKIPVTDRSFRKQIDTGHRCNVVSTSNMVQDQVVPSQKPSLMSLHLNQHSAMAGRRLGRPEFCRGMLATQGSFNTQNNLSHRRQLLDTNNVVRDQMTPTQKPPVACLHLNHQSAMGDRRLGRQEISKERRQQARRHGVCDGSDGTQDKRVFVHVLKFARK